MTQPSVNAPHPIPEANAAVETAQAAAKQPDSVVETADQTAGQLSKAERRMLNPVLRGLERRTGCPDAPATLGGVCSKAIFLVATIGLGMLVYALCRASSYLMVIEGYEALFGLTGPWHAGITVCCLLLVLVPCLIGRARRCTALLATLWSLAVGFLLPFAALALSVPAPLNGWASPAQLLGVLAVTLVGTATLLYAIHPPKAKRCLPFVLATAALALAIDAGVALLGGALPLLADAAKAFKASPLPYILVGLVAALVGALLLRGDYRQLKRLLASELSLRCEWVAALGLAFGVVWLPLKLPVLLVKALMRKD